MPQTADRCPQASPWSPRETELLEVTLRLLQEHGYDQLTVDAVASAARASKSTVYRRWPSGAQVAAPESCLARPLIESGSDRKANGWKGFHL
jgi:AcrR family transcriptional regulator